MDVFLIFISREKELIFVLKNKWGPSLAANDLNIGPAREDVQKNVTHVWYLYYMQGYRKQNRKEK